MEKTPGAFNAEMSNEEEVTAALAAWESLQRPSVVRNFRVIAGALYQFAASLTTLKTPITVGKNHSAAEMAELVDAFCKENLTATYNWEEPLVTYWKHYSEVLLSHPEAKTVPAKLTSHDGLTDLINRCSLENGSDTPDSVLSQYLINCIAVFDIAVRERTRLKG